MITPDAASLVDYVEASAARFPERCAVVDPDGSTLTYRELDERADRIAGFLVARGVKPGDRVGVIAPKSAAVVVAFIGVMKARAAYVPADHAAPPERNRTILGDCGVKAAFLATSCASVLDAWPEATPRPAAVVHFDGATWDDAVTHDPIRVDGALGERSRIHPLHIRIDGHSQGRDAEPAQRACVRRLVLRRLCANRARSLQQSRPVSFRPVGAGHLSPAEARRERAPHLGSAGEVTGRSDAVRRSSRS